MLRRSFETSKAGRARPRRVRRSQEAAPPPPHGEQPRSRSWWPPRRVLGRVPRSIDPAIEPRGRRVRVEERLRRRRLSVLLRVLQHVEEGVLHLRRRPEIVTVVAVIPDLSLPSPEQLVEAPGEADRETAHPRGERGLARRLSDQVDVIVLDGVMRDLEIGAWRFLQQLQEHLPHALAAQRRKPATRPQREVHGIAPCVRRPLPMGDTSALPRRTTAPFLLPPWPCVRARTSCSGRRFLFPAPTARTMRTARPNRKAPRRPSRSHATAGVATRDPGGAPSPESARRPAGATDRARPRSSRRARSRA